MIILAIDASLNCPGFAVLRVGESRDIELITTAAVDNKKNASRTYARRKTTAMKLQEIARQFHHLCSAYNPDVIVRERGFSKYPAATQLIFRVVGVLDFVAYDSFGKEIVEITPTSVKMCITGDGKAEKRDVAKQLPLYVGKIRFMTDDESDATALGITYAIDKGLIDRVVPDKPVVENHKIGRPKKKKRQVKTNDV